MSELSLQELERRIIALTERVAVLEAAEAARSASESTATVPEPETMIRYVVIDKDSGVWLGDALWSGRRCSTEFEAPVFETVEEAQEIAKKADAAQVYECRVPPDEGSISILELIAQKLLPEPPTEGYHLFAHGLGYYLGMGKWTIKDNLPDGTRVVYPDEASFDAAWSKPPKGAVLVTTAAALSSQRTRLDELLENMSGAGEGFVVTPADLAELTG